MLNLKPQPTTKTNIKAVCFNVEGKYRLQFFRLLDDGKRNLSRLPKIEADRGFQRKDTTEAKTKFCLVNNEGILNNAMAEIAETKTSKLTLKFYEYYTVKHYDVNEGQMVDKVQRKEIQIWDDEKQEFYTLVGFWDKDKNQNPEADWEIIFDIAKAKPYLAEMVGA